MEKYKVLLVDDEQTILRGMEEGIPWEKFGFEVAGTAANGQEAWEFIQNDRPDVLISDIRMPFMNGLELVKTLKDNYIRMKTILVSGYDDFEYAQQAIRYGVSEYLLKPISMPQMEELLSRIHHEITAEIEEKNNKTYLEQMYKENLPILRERFLTELIEGRIPTEKIEKRLKKLQIDFNWSSCMAAVIQLVYDEEDIEMKFFVLSKVLHEIFENFGAHLIFQCYEKIVLIVEVEDYNKAQNVLKCLNEANLIGERYLQTSFYCGVGNFVEGIENIQYSYKNAVEAIEYSLVSEDEHVIYIQDIEDLEEEVKFSGEQYIKDLSMAIKMSDKNSIQCQVDNIFSEMDRCKMNYEEYQAKIIEICFSLTKIARQYELADKKYSDPRSFMTEILSSNTGEEIKKWFLKYINGFAEMVNQKRIDNNELLAQKAKDFIDQNFGCSDLSVETLCDFLHISPSYFSSIFKKVHGISFINYLTDRRIEEAIFLLKTTDYKTKVISEMVGYPESNYFSYVFKKKTNISPANFRKKERNQSNV